MTIKKFLKNKGYQTIPLKTLPSGHHVLHTVFNKKKGVFILDTGASNTCIDVSKAKKFKLKLKETEHKATGAGSLEIDIQTAHKNKMHIQDWKVKKLDVVVMDLSHINQALTIFDTKIDGIIGADILQAGKGIIQYDKELLYLK